MEIDIYTVVDEITDDLLDAIEDNFPTLEDILCEISATADISVGGNVDWVYLMALIAVGEAKWS